MRKIFEKQLKYSERKMFLITIVATTILGLINIVINYTTAEGIVNEAGSSIVWVYIGVPVSAVILELFYSVACAIITYFTAAAMQKGFDIKIFFKLAYRILISLPLITLADMAGFIVLGKKFTDYGFLGILSYLPFYGCLLLSTYYLAPKYVELSKKQSMAMAVVLTIGMIFVSYPYKF